MKVAFKRSAQSPDLTPVFEEITIPPALQATGMVETTEPPSEGDKLRAAIRSVLGKKDLTAQDIIEALDTVYSVVKLKRKMTTCKPYYTQKNAVYPAITIGGKYLEDGGLRYGKKVTVRTFPNFVVISVDNPGPDPAIDEKYAHTKAGRQQMKDIQDTMLYGMPLWKIHQYAEEMKNRQGDMQQVAET